jgi:hypothetical protein
MYENATAKGWHPLGSKWLSSLDPEFNFAFLWFQGVKKEGGQSKGEKL